MYIETSSPRKQGDAAKLNSPMLQFSGSMCLKFYYHMYGANIATLNVIINGNNVFTASGNKDNKWLRADIDVSLSGKHAVRDINTPFNLKGTSFIPIVTTLRGILWYSRSATAHGGFSLFLRTTHLFNHRYTYMCDSSLHYTFN